MTVILLLLVSCLSACTPRAQRDSTGLQVGRQLAQEPAAEKQAGQPEELPAVHETDRALVSRWKGVEFTTQRFEDDNKSCLLIYRLAYFGISHVYEHYISIQWLDGPDSGSIEAWVCRSVPADALSDSYYFGWVQWKELPYNDNHDSALVAPEVALKIEGGQIVGVYRVDAFRPIGDGTNAPPLTRYHLKRYSKSEQLPVVPCTVSRLGWVPEPGDGLYMKVTAGYRLDEYPFLLLPVEYPCVYLLRGEKRDVHGDLIMEPLPFKFYYVVNLRAVGGAVR